ncbi:MAG TPA: pirin family protein [Casimicrobiaceae bacterium]|nr:pirin family protein [Casimicrobiaceae bacterium]
MKRVIAVHQSPPMHWVGDGFPVRSLFSYDGLGRELSPFLLLDHAGPVDFAPATKRRGVGEHPHRGFETVTIVYAGEVEHRDSAGNGGRIGPGDVQWMTAASGVMHEEFHSGEFTRAGGTMEMAQLWVNLPAKDKMAKPRYQSIVAADIPSVELPDGAGRVRVIAGRFDSHSGPAQTFTDLNVWDVELAAGRTATLQVPDGHTTAIALFRGAIVVNDAQEATAPSIVQFAREGDSVRVKATRDATFLLLSGEPIDEPIAGYGPFVMNTRDEIMTAIRDLQEGRFARLAPA